MNAPTKLAEVTFAGLSEIGNIREENQDAILVPDAPLPGQFAFLTGLADGMGGFASGDIASKLALSTFRQVILDSRGNSIEKMLKKGVEIANLEIFKTARELDAGKMGTTLTMAYIEGDQLFLAHVGDSRAYLFRNNSVSCLTNDHSLVADMVRSRLLQPDAVRNHSQRSMLTKAVGLDLFVSPEITSHKLLAGDRLILCCDGIWSALEDSEISKLASDHKEPQEFAKELIYSALDHGSDDNCSVIVADIKVFRSLAVPVGQPVTRKWFGIFDLKI